MDDRTRQIIEASGQAGWIVEPLAREILASAGLTVSRSAWAHSGEEAVVSASAIGFPVVVKVVSPKVMHKSDVGGVAVGLKDPDAVRDAYDRMARIKGFDGVLVDQMVRGVELIIGSKQDQQFGTVVLAGIGGTAVEVYKDVALRMAPVSGEEALKAINSLKGAALLKGHRGAPAANLKSLAELVAGFSKLAHSLAGSVESIDLNPVMCGPDRAVIADARMVVAKKRSAVSGER